MNIQSADQTVVTNVPYNPIQRQSGLYLPHVAASSSYGAMVNNNMNYSYDPRLHHGSINHVPPNPYFVNCETCFKCNGLIYLSNGQFYKCQSCGRFSCIACVNNQSFSMSYYQCEYCVLNVALQTTRY